MELGISGIDDSLRGRCIDVILRHLQEGGFDPQDINELCRSLSPFQHILNPILEALIVMKGVTDVALLAFLVPERLSLSLQDLSFLKNSTLKMIGYNCVELQALNLAGCSQVTNSVVRSILCGCPDLRFLVLDKCIRVSDGAFDIHQCPFSPFQSYNLEHISLQGCNQITGNITDILIKLCRKLKHLNLSQCKRIVAREVQSVFEHRQLVSLNLGFSRSITDDTFALLPAVNDKVQVIKLQPQLEDIILTCSAITDYSCFRIATISTLRNLSLQWCQHITDDGIGIILQTCTLLRDINLISCNISDVTLENMAHHCHHLSVLNVSWCQAISDDGVVALSIPGTACQLLQSVTLVWCQKLSDIAMHALSGLPNIRSIDIKGCTLVSKKCIEYVEKCKIGVVAA